MARVYSEFPLSGRHGDFIFYNRNGKTFMRKATESNDPKTDKQLISRAKLRTAGNFIKCFKNVLRIGYQAPENHTTPLLEAQNFLIANSLVEVPPTGKFKYQFDVNLPSFMISRGLIESPVITSIERTGTEIHLTWNNALGPIHNRLYDTLNVVAYIPGWKEPLWFNGTGTRQAGAGTVVLPVNSNENIHLWAFYSNQHQGMKPAKENVSDSVYLGEY